MKNNSDKKFKRAEIGMIPSDWDIINFNEAFTVLNNNTYSRDALNYIYGEYKNIHYGDILILFNEFVDLLDNKVPYLNNYLKVNTIKLEDGDIIFADTAEDETAGKAVEVINTKGIKAVSGLHTILCRKTQDIFSKYYLGYYFNSKVFHNQLLRYMTGSKVLSISKSDIKKTIVLLPPKPEQEKIANALTRIDNLIEDYEKLIKKKEKIKQGLMQNLLTGKVRLKGYDKKWIIKELKELGNIVTGTTPSRNNKHYWNGNINWITAQDFKGKYIAESVEKISAEGAKSCRMLPKNSVIVTCIASIGLNAIITKESATNQQINGIICNEHYDNEFIYYLLSYYNEYIKSFASQTAVPIINKRVFEEITILLPMEKQEQQAISKVLSNADNEINGLKIKLNKIIDIKKGMLDNLLTGKIRL